MKSKTISISYSKQGCGHSRKVEAELLPYYQDRQGRTRWQVVESRLLPIFNSLIWGSKTKICKVTSRVQVFHDLETAQAAFDSLRDQELRICEHEYATV